MSSQAVPAHAEIPPPRVEEVSPGVYAYIQMDGSWFLNNAGAIVGSRSAMAAWAALGQFAANLGPRARHTQLLALNARDGQTQR